MKRIITLLACLPLLAAAQKNLDGLMNAERQFAGASIMQGARTAFLGSLDSAHGVVFHDGNAVSAQAYWSGRQFPGLLSWGPEWAEVSADGSFGYTTGPWTYTPKGSDTIQAQGQFVTVWHYVNGDWKFLADIGIENNRSVSSKNTMKPRSTTSFPADTALLLKAENDFNKIFTTGPAAAYQRYLASNSIIDRNGKAPAMLRKNQSALIAATPASISLESLGFGLAASGDMAYTYGRTTLNGKADNYLRVWHRDRQGWKIIADVLSY